VLRSTPVGQDLDLDPMPLRLEQRERARRHLEAALARRPGNIPALDSYAAMLRAEGSDDAVQRL